MIYNVIKNEEKEKGRKMQTKYKKKKCENIKIRC